MAHTRARALGAGLVSIAAQRSKLSVVDKERHVLGWVDITVPLSEQQAAQFSDVVDAAAAQGGPALLALDPGGPPPHVRLYNDVATTPNAFARSGGPAILGPRSMFVWVKPHDKVWEGWFSLDEARYDPKPAPAPPAPPSRAGQSEAAPESARGGSSGHGLAVSAPLVLQTGGAQPPAAAMAAASENEGAGGQGEGPAHEWTVSLRPRGRQQPTVSYSGSPHVGATTVATTQPLDRIRCQPALKNCYECASGNFMKRSMQQCVVCKNRRYLINGRCRKKCKPGYFPHGSGRFFRTCTLTAGKSKPKSALATTPAPPTSGTVRHVPNADVPCCTITTREGLSLTRCVEDCVATNGCIAVVHGAEDMQCQLKCGSTSGIVNSAHTSVTFMPDRGSRIMQCNPASNGTAALSDTSFGEIIAVVKGLRTHADRSALTSEDAEVLDDDDDANIGGSENDAFNDVLIFTTTAQDQDDELVSYAASLNEAYCHLWGCTWHVFQGQDARVVGTGSYSFERYRALRALLAEPEYLRFNTFIFVDPLTTISRRKINLLKCLPFSSGYDVIFGNSRTTPPADTPRDTLSTAVFAAKRSQTVNLFLDRVLGSRDGISRPYPVCADIIETGIAVANTYDASCIISLIPAMRRIGILSATTPIQAYDRVDFVGAAKVSAPMPPLLSCAWGSCAAKLPVVAICAEGTGAAKCDVLRTKQDMLETRQAEAREGCDTYLIENGQCYAASTEKFPDPNLASREREDNIRRNSYSIVISTFARDDALISLLPHWLSCPFVSSVNVVWHNPDREPVVRLKELTARYRRLHVHHQTVDRLSNRYLPKHEFDTDGTFSIDDDEYISCKLMTTAFGVWKTNQESMVGFNPRDVDYAMPSAATLKEEADEDAMADIGYQWNSVCRQNQRPATFAPCGHYNVLFVTKGGFLHKRFLQLYFSSPWDSARSMVDKWTTGEDMLISAVHAAHMAPGTARGVIAVAARHRHLNDFNGLLTHDDMRQQEDNLVTDSNSLHLLTQGHRGSVRLSIIKATIAAGLSSPQRYSEWYVHSTAGVGFQSASWVCTENAALHCYVY